MPYCLVPCCSIAWLACASSLFAVEAEPAPAYRLQVTTDRAAPIYARDEAVTFTIQVSRGELPVDDIHVKWTISKDGVAPIRTGEATLENGTFMVSGKLAEPGFLQCRVDMTPPEGAPQTALASAAIEPTRIMPSLPPPDDFDLYWKEQRRRLNDVPLNVRLTPIPTSISGVECFDVQADGLGGPLSAVIARPIGAKSKSLPAIVLCHGAGVQSSQVSTAVEWAKEGMLALDFNVHGLPNRKPRAFYTELYAGELKSYPLRGRESRETAFFRELYLRLMRALDTACAQPEWDGRTLVVFGRSQGGGQAIVASGLDRRVTFCAAQLPAMCDHTGCAVDRINGWPKLVSLNSTGVYDETLLTVARYFDAVNFAARSKAEAIFTVGYLDVTCPPTGVYAAFNAWLGKKKMLDLPKVGHIADASSDRSAKQAVLKHVKLQSTSR